MERVREFSSGAICLVLASDVFMEEDYIRDFDEFMDSKNETAYMVPNINNEGGVARTLAIKRTYLSKWNYEAYSHAK
jgi:hypothetical protein